MKENDNIIVCPRCHYAILRKDKKLFGNKCIKCGYCIECDSV